MRNTTNLTIEKLEDRNNPSGLPGVTEFAAVSLSGEVGELHPSQGQHLGGQCSNRLDVNRDGQISAIDALIPTNEINQNGTGQVQSLKKAWMDVSGDNQISPVDSLIVINYINRNGAGPKNPATLSQAVQITDLRRPDSVTGTIKADHAFFLDGLGPGVTSDNGTFYINGIGENNTADTAPEFTYIVNGVDPGNFQFQVPYIADAPLTAGAVNSIDSFSWEINFFDLPTHTPQWTTPAELSVYADAQCTDVSTVVDLSTLNDQIVQLYPGQMLAFTADETTRFFVEAQEEDGSQIRSYEYLVPAGKFLHTQFHHPIDAAQWVISKYDSQANSEQIGTLAFVGVDQTIHVEDLTSPDGIPRSLEADNKIVLSATNLDTTTGLAFLHGEMANGSGFTVPFNEHLPTATAIHFPFSTQSPPDIYGQFPGESPSTLDVAVLDIATHDNLWGGNHEFIVNPTSINPERFQVVDLDDLINNGGELTAQPGDLLSFTTQTGRNIRIIHESREGTHVEPENTIDLNVAPGTYLNTVLSTPPEGTLRTVIHEYQFGASIHIAEINTPGHPATQHVVGSLQDPNLFPLVVDTDHVLVAEHIPVSNPSSPFVLLSGQVVNGNTQFNYVINPYLPEYQQHGLGFSIPYFGPLPGPNGIEDAAPEVIDLAFHEIGAEGGFTTVWSDHSLTIDPQEVNREDLQVVNIDALQGQRVDLDPSRQLAIGGSPTNASFRIAYYDPNTNDLIGAVELITRPNEYAFITLNPPKNARIVVEDFSDDNHSTIPVGELRVI